MEENLVVEDTRPASCGTLRHAILTHNHSSALAPGFVSGSDIGPCKQREAVSDDPLWYKDAVSTSCMSTVFHDSAATSTGRSSDNSHHCQQREIERPKP